jgi:hypothetical protein
MPKISILSGITKINNNICEVLYDQNIPHFFSLLFGKFEQKFYIPSCCDANSERDLNIALLDFDVIKFDELIRMKWIYQSTLWVKTYFLDIYNDYIEYYYELKGNHRISYLHYFEGISALGFEEHHFTKHFNDHKTTSYREYSKASPVSFTKVFNPEPNVYCKHHFDFYEYAQISVNSDFTDYCGGNFYFNPGILCFLIKSDAFDNWLSLGLAVDPGNYCFSDYEYIGGMEFGMNINYCGIYNVNNVFITPKIFFCIGKTERETIKNYVNYLEITSLVNRSISFQSQTWWRGPIICPVGHQYYQTDLFRIRSPRERPKDLAGYFACTQTNSESFIKIIDSYGIDWRVFIIDVKWSINAGLKLVDIGRWPDMKSFVNALHNRGKKVLIWWSPWDTEGWDIGECITYHGDENCLYKNRPGRFSKFDHQLTNNEKIAPDITLLSVQKKITAQLKNLLGTKGMDIDGLKIDHTAATPALFGLHFPRGSKKIIGIELLHYYQKSLYDTIKRIKPEALIVGQSPNPYFNDCTDMIRLGDTYTHNKNSLVQQMNMRYMMAHLANSEWLIDMDGWPMPSLQAFIEYMEYQVTVGTPSLYYATNLDTTGERIPQEYFSIIKNLWSKYLGENMEK